MNRSLASVTTICIAVALVALAKVQVPTYGGETDQVLPSPNAYTFYRRAFEALVDIQKIGPGLPLAQQRTVVARNARSLHLLRSGFAYECLPITSSIPGSPNPLWLNKLASLLTEGDVNWADSKKKQAASSYLDIMRLGNDVGHGEGLLGMMVGKALEKTSRTALWKIASNLDAETSRQAARRLEIIEGRRNTYAEVLQAEWKAEEAWFKWVAKESPERPAWDIEAALKNLGEMMVQELGEARKPYRLSRQTALFMDMEAYKQSGDALDKNAANMPDFHLRWQASVIHLDRGLFTRNQADSLLLITSLALRAYKLDHGKYPSSLNALVSEYLEQVPTDPFSLEKPLIYQSKGSSYVLYSVGYDGVDDKGRPAQRINILEGKDQSPPKGDIVAGS